MFTFESMLIQIKGEVTERTAEMVNDAIISGEPIEVHIDSKGGDLFSGLEIFNRLQEHDAEVKIIIQGVAGSIASVIALAGSSKPSISSTGSIVIHNAHTDNIEGNHNDLRIVADSLEKYSEIVAKIYSVKTKLSNSEALSLMNNETVMNASEAIELGFAGKEVQPITPLSKINKINMKLIDKIKQSLGVKNELVTTETIETVDNQDEVVTEGGSFTPEQLAEITEIVNLVVAEALSGAPMQEEIQTTVGNTIATVLNKVVSDGKVPNETEILEIEEIPQQEGITSFYKKINEIKEKSNAVN